MVECKARKRSRAKSGFSTLFDLSKQRSDRTFYNSLLEQRIQTSQNEPFAKHGCEEQQRGEQGCRLLA